MISKPATLGKNWYFQLKTIYKFGSIIYNIIQKNDQKKMKPIIKLYIYITILLLVSGCSSTKSVYIGKGEFIKMSSQNQITSDSLTLDATNFLVTNCLKEQFSKSPEEVIYICSQQVNLKKSNIIVEHNYRTTLKVIIDLCIYQAKNSDEDSSIEYWMSSCYYSYRYLFGNKFSTPFAKLTTPNTSIVINYYNLSLYKIFLYLQKNKLIHKDSFNIPMFLGSVTFKKAINTLPWELSSFEKFIICPDYEIENFNEIIFQKGLGLPLAAIPDKQNNFLEIGKNIKLIKYLYPCTFLLKFDDLESENNEIITIPKYLDFYKDIYTNINDREIQLLNNYSAVLGNFLEKYPQVTEADYFFNPGDIIKDDLMGLYMLSPYDEKKIPILFIHGLISDPQSMYQIVNTLMQYKQIRKNFQFWFYFYPSGQPILLDTYILRKILSEMEKKFGQPDQQSNFDDMILVGYSQGGLIAQLAIQDSKGSYFEKEVLHTQLKDLELSKKRLDEIKDMLVFKPLPFVKQTIFISTPHRGADMASWTSMQLLSDLISSPHSYYSNYKNMLLNVSKFTRKYNDNILNGNAVDNLDPDSLFIKYTSKLPYGKNIKIHSIIGNEDSAGEVGGTDGIVPYSSSHLNNSSSEVIIQSDHHSIYKPACAKAILKILLNTIQKTK